MSRFPLLLALSFAILSLSRSAAAAGKSDQPLARIMARVDAAKAAGQTPVVVLDLDDTLFRVAYRTNKILLDWSSTQPPSLGLRAKIAALEPLKMPWSLPQTFDQMGIHDAALRKSADAAWGRGFFSNDYLEADRTVPGAVVFVRMLVHRGARVVYLTGRDIARMQVGTERALKKAGFPPVPTEATLILKSDYKQKDAVFKEQACASILKMGTVIAAIDNEPGNCNVFRKTFPGASVVCIDTQHSPTAPPLDPGIALLPDFRF